MDQKPLTESLIVPGTRPGSVSEAWKLAYPTIIGMLSTTVMWTIDAMLLGRIGKVEMAAAGLGGVIIWTLYTFFVGGVHAVTTFVSQAKGAGNHRECSVFTWQGIYLALAGAIILAVFLWKFDWILALAGPDEAVINHCLRYSRARMTGAFFVLSMFAISSFFRGIGDVKTPMVVAIVANLINITLDVFLIFGLGPFPRLTTFGAGIATAMANCAGCLLIMVLFLRPKIHRIYHSRTDHPFRPAAMIRLLKVGVPMGVQFFLDMGSFAVFLAIMGRLGTNQLAASNIGVQLLSFSFMPANGIAKAATTMVGQYMGAGYRSLAQKCGWTAVKMNLVYSLFVAAVFLVARENLFIMFNRDPEVIAAGLAIIPLLAAFQILDAIQMSYSGALQGAGDTTFTMIAYAISSWILFVPLALLFAYPLGFGMPGGWAGGVIHFTVLNTVLTLRYRSGVWKHRKI